MSKSSRVPILATLAVATAMSILPQDAQAQSRGRSSGRAVPRSSAPRPGRPVVVRGRPAGNPYYYRRPYYARPYYGSHYGGIGIGIGFPIGYGGFGWYGYGYPGYYGYPRYGYPGYGPGYGYGPGAYAGTYRPYGGVRIQLPQRQAEVWAGGYFVGHVDDFDGSFQQLNLEPGAHRIEIRDAGYDTIAFDVKIEPGRTIHYRSDMKPVP